MHDRQKNIDMVPTTSCTNRWYFCYLFEDLDLFDDSVLNSAFNLADYVNKIAFYLSMFIVVLFGYLGYRL